MSFYGDIANLAREQLREFGQMITLRDVSEGGAYDPNTSAPAAGTANADHKRLGLLLDWSEGLTEERGTAIRQGDKKLYMEAGIVPSMEDQIITADGTVYGIVGISELNPAGTVLLYTLHLRR